MHAQQFSIYVKKCIQQFSVLVSISDRQSRIFAMRVSIFVSIVQYRIHDHQYHFSKFASRSFIIFYDSALKFIRIQFSSFLDLFHLNFTELISRSCPSCLTSRYDLVRSRQLHRNFQSQRVDDKFPKISKNLKFPKI